jgi:hypothetical protein
MQTKKQKKFKITHQNSTFFLLFSLYIFGGFGIPIERNVIQEIYYFRNTYDNLLNGISSSIFVRL